jgi:hypothetical protein
VSGKQGPPAEGKGMRTIANGAERPTTRPINSLGGAEAAT